jgi:hypothetical protein
MMARAGVTEEDRRAFVRARLLGELDERRRDAIRFAALMFVLTPAFLALAVLLFVFVVRWADLPFFDDLAFEYGFAVGAAGALAFMYVAYLVRGKPRWLAREADRGSELLALAALAGVAVLTFATSLRSSAPGLFWPLYAIGCLAFLGLLGRAYQARESYYLGWFGGWVDDPFTIQDDLDRAHVGLGFALAVPNAVLDAYGDVFGASWMWRAIDEDEAAIAADALVAAGRGDPAAVRRTLSRLAPSGRRRVAKGLKALGFVAPGPAFRLTVDGRKFLAEVSSPAGDDLDSDERRRR